MKKRNRVKRRIGILAMLLVISAGSFYLSYDSIVSFAPDRLFDTDIPKPERLETENTSGNTEQQEPQKELQEEQIQNQTEKPQENRENNTAEPQKESQEEQIQDQTEKPQESLEEPDAEKEDNKKDNQETQEEKTENVDFREPDFTDRFEDAFAPDEISEEELIERLGVDDLQEIIKVEALSGASSVKVESKDGIYEIFLSTKGKTIIKVVYYDRDGNVKKADTTITYIRPEGSTPEEKKPVINTNINDGGTLTNAILNFDVWITDYRGKSLGYTDMVVKVNGEEADYVGEMDRQTYNVMLMEGENHIEIKITDEYQYTVTKEYKVFLKTGKAEITISLEGGVIGIPYFIEPEKMEVDPDVPLSFILDEFLKSHGIDYSHAGSLKDGFYLSAITKKNLIRGFKIPDELIEKINEDHLIFDEESYYDLNTLGEFDFCQGSGWMYSINGLYSSYGFNKAYVQDGDVVRIRFTLAYGKDIGGYAATGGTYGVLKNYGKEW